MAQYLMSVLDDVGDRVTAEEPAAIGVALRLAGQGSRNGNRRVAPRPILSE